MKKNRINTQWVLLRLLMLIFLYSAAVKILDFGKFSSELAKSPFLHKISDFMAIVVPLTELAVAILILVKATRRWALYVYLYMMTAFTAYVYLMKEKAYYLPCACMGLFDSLGWNAHIYIDALLTVVVLISIMLDKANGTKKSWQLKLPDLKINPGRPSPSGHPGSIGKDGFYY